ncbi:MAG: hypothetical protein HRU14_13300 [Planctomycetes bacterium]|nr:hypothetical protein [Planctomycetota bacterium]
MKLRTAGLLGLTAAVVGVGWWFLAEPDDLVEPDGGRSAEATAGGSTPEDDTAHATEAAAEADQAVGIDTERFREGEHRALAADALTLLFESETHVPQRGARVELRPLSQSMVVWSGQQRAAPGPPWQVLTTDADGEVLLRQLPPGGLEVFARSRDLLGYETLSAERVTPGQRVVITMKPIRKVAVQVVDQAGQPVAGAPVTVSSAALRGPGYHWTTNPDGVAAFEITPMHGKAYTAKEFRAEVRLPAGSVYSETVPWVDDDVTEVLVAVKRGVLVRLKVVETSGEPAVGRKSVRWETAKSPSRSLSVNSVISLSWNGSLGQEISEKKRAFEGSETVLAGFKPATKIRFILEEEGRCDSEEVVGLPVGEGSVEVVMKRGAPAPVLEIPLVHEGGRPVTEGKFQLTASYPKPGKNSGSGASMRLSMTEGGGILALSGIAGAVVRTPNDEGIVRLTVDPGKTVKLKVARRRPGGGTPSFLWSSGGDKVKPLLEATLPAFEAGEVRRLEPLVIPAMPLVVAGHVVDGGGAGVGGALVRLAPVGRQDNPWGSTVFNLSQSKVRTAADGSFSIRSDSKIEGWSVFARLGDSGRSALVPFLPGATDVTLSLVPAGALDGVLVSTLPRKKAVIRLEAEDGSVHPNLRWIYPEMDLSEDCDGAGNFRFEGLSSGRYTAHVRLAGYEVLVVRDVVVESGKANRDPRLDGVTVGGSLHATVVTTRRPDGTAVNGARVEVEVPKNGGEKGPRLSERTRGNGNASFILPRGARRDVKITAKDFLAYDQKDAVFPLDVTLDPGTELAVQLDVAGGGLPDDPKISAWQVRLRPAKEAVATSIPEEGHGHPVILSAEGIRFSLSSGGSRSSRSVNLDRDTRRATFKAVPPGKWEVTIRPQVTREKKSTGGGGRSRRSSKWGKTHKLGPVETRSGVWQKSVRFTVDASVLASLLPQ